MSAVKGHADIALGAIVGSNIFNLLIVLPVPGLLGPLSLKSDVFNRDWLFTLSLAVLLMLFAGLAQREAAHQSLATGELGRMAGVVLLGTYISYLTILVMASELTG
jgi:cation:H+ antiporter